MKEKEAPPLVKEPVPKGFVIVRTLFWTAHPPGFEFINPVVWLRVQEV
jgi:hypothetical protein